jgi:hypothetical protein
MTAVVADWAWLLLGPAGGAKSQARAFVLACAVLACLTTWLAVQISYAQKHFSTGLAEKDQGALLLPGQKVPINRSCHMCLAVPSQHNCINNSCCDCTTV